MNKKSLVLDTLIKQYLDYNEPIGSSELRKLLDVNIAASTIRVYFKQMSNDGLIFQYHTSGGRIPTLETLRSYWMDYFDQINCLEINNIYNIEEASEHFGIYFMALYTYENKLLRVINVENLYIILVFTNDEIAMQYNAKLEGLFEKLLGDTIDEIRELLKSIGINYIAKKIDLALKQHSICSGEKYLYSACLNDGLDLQKFKNVTIFKDLSFGVLFDGDLPKKYMVVHKKAIINNKEASFVMFAEISSNFDGFLRAIV